VNKNNRKYVKGEVNPQPYLNRRARLGAEDRSRTYTPVMEADFESQVSCPQPSHNVRLYLLLNSFSLSSCAGVCHRLSVWLSTWLSK